MQLQYPKINDWRLLHIHLPLDRNILDFDR